MRVPGSDGEAVAAAIRVIELVNGRPGMWRDLFPMLADEGRTDWLLVEHAIRKAAYTTRRGYVYTSTHGDI
jgi:hypothetical protein